MISAIRKFSTTIYAKILLGIVVIPFVFWGMGSSFTGGNKNVIVQIDDNKFPIQEFANFVSSHQVSGQKINAEIIDRLLSVYIGDKLIEMESEYFGIRLSDNSLSKLIMNQKEFMRENTFSRPEYEKFLLSNNFNVVNFEANFARQEKKRQLINFIGGGVYPTKFSVNSAFNKVNQKRDIKLINLNDAFEKKINYTESSIKTYYKDNKNEYNQLYKTIEILEINPKKLMGINEYNDLFFKKIDDIQDSIAEGETLNNLKLEYNLTKGDSFLINELGENIDSKKVNNISEKIVKTIFSLSENEKSLFVEEKDKFFIVEILKTENIQKDLDNENVVRDIQKKLMKAEKIKLLSEIISKINQNKFTKNDFDKISLDNNVPIQNIKLKSINDNEILKLPVVKEVYSFPKNKIIIVNDIFLTENFLIYTDDIEEASIEKNSDEYNKYFDLSKMSITNGLFNTYDNYIKEKYKIDINYKALNTVKSYFN
tara:strand:+ start:1216 stop:2664 length:1449 start_codon:yes stop_codon:yes gene_type:complete